MPELLRTFADWNPVSAVTSAVRLLWGDPNPSLGSLSWSMQNPVIVALAWSFAIIVICVPVATVLFRRRTTD